MVMASLGYLSQLTSSVGMITLSRYTFFNNHDLHMIGSYLFFSGQTMMIMFFGLLSLWMARSAKVNKGLAGKNLINPEITRIRGYFGPAVTAFAIFFLLLFFLKGFKYPYGNEELYATYVLAEPAAISGYLSFQALWLIDLAIIMRSAVRALIADQKLPASV
jgi:hypothetical protein